jgi:hypothetical protein
MDSFPPAKQRVALLEFTAQSEVMARFAVTSAANGASTASAAVSTLYGKASSYFTGSARGWTSAKVTRDGDEAGCLILDRLPMEAEGAIIRESWASEKKARGRRGGARAASRRRSHNQPFRARKIGFSDIAGTTGSQTSLKR